MNPAAHPPLLTVAEWEAAQSEHHVRPPRGRRRDPALLAGIIRCSGCGHAMSRSGGGVSGSRKIPVVYACVVRHSGARCPEPTAITGHIIDAHVTEIALHAMRSVTASSNPDVAVDAAAAAANAAENEMAVFLRRVTSAGLDEREYLSALHERRETARAARESLALAQSSRLPALHVSPHEVWDDLTVGQRNRVLRGLLEVVVVTRAGRGKTVPAGQRAAVVARGAGVRLPVVRGGAASGIVPLDLSDVGSPYLLGLPVGHDGGEGHGG